METNFLSQALIYLAAGVIAVPLFKRLGLGSVLGYLAAGMAIGPWGLRLIGDPQTVLHFAEFGVVLLLFLTGLELDPRRLWALRRPILGMGAVQVLATAGAAAAIAAALGQPLAVALVAGMGIAMSSTAIALASLQERNTSTSACPRCARPSARRSTPPRPRCVLSATARWRRAA
jgi:glutathione-regulated potassium-efflux system ancillary protein KefC